MLTLESPRITDERSNAPRSHRPIVLHVRVVTGAGGGPDKTILNSPEFLKPLGYDALCAYMHPPQDPLFAELCRRAAEKQVHLVSIPDVGPWDLRVIFRLLDVCRQNHVEIWHGHDYKSNVLGLLIKRFWPMRLATTVHGWVTHTRRTPVYYGIDRICLRHYERVICVSADLVEQCIRSGVDPKRCVLIPNAVDTAVFRRQQSSAEAKRSLGIPPDQFLIGAVGRLSAEKGFDLLIAAVGSLVSAGLNVGLVIAGNGDQEALLRRQIAELGLERRVHLLGFRSDVVEIYQALDTFALSSYREGLPNVLLEAMACEVPVVATSVAGIPQLIHSDINGLLIPPGDREALASALRRLLADKQLRESLSAEALRVIEEHYTFERRMRKIAAVYEDLQQ